MTLQQLKYVIELSKHNSISSAAQSLSISQPSLSMAVKELEEEFHITILNRNHRGVSFTAQGLDFGCCHKNHIPLYKCKRKALFAIIAQKALPDYSFKKK